MNNYIVWRNKDDRVVAHGTRDEIARQMGRTIPAVDNIIHRAMHGENDKYTVIRYDDIEEVE